MSDHGQASLLRPSAAAAGRALPVELAFLARHGVPPDRLDRAAATAAACGVEPLTALLRGGHLGEERFYRALAREAGLPFLDGPLRLGPETRFPESVVAGLAPLLDWPRYALAPGAAGVRALLAGPPRAHGRYGLTTPTRLRRAVFARRADEIAGLAANGLRARAPHWCYWPGLSAGRLAAAAGGLAVLAAGLRLAPAAVAGGLAGLAGAVFLAMATFRLAALFVPASTTPAPVPRRDDRDLPVYTVVVALYREAAVVPCLVRALAALDYPAAKLDIKLVLEADDEETRATLADIPLPGRFEVLVAPPGEPRTKPRALNVALPLARGRFLVVFDAEDVPDPGQLRAATSAFERLSARVACLQGRLVIDNTRDGWLPRLFTLEYAALFDVLGPALAAWELPYPLGGTSTHFRTATLRHLHGWDAWNVTEDADLGLRLALQGYVVGDLPSSTLEEAPARLGAWMRQRVRWLKGYMQTGLTHARRPGEALVRVGPAKLFGALTVTFGTVAAALGYPFFVGGALLAFADAGTFSGEGLGGNALAASGVMVFLAGLAAMILPPMLGALRRGWPGLAPAALLMPVYYLLVSIAAWLALVELVRAPFRWNKTEHGLARTSRRTSSAQS